MARLDKDLPQGPGDGPRPKGPVLIFAPDRRTYIRTHLIMAAFAMAAGMAILLAFGNPHVWAGALGGLAAVSFRGWFLMDETLAETWTLTATALEGPGEQHVLLAQIDRLRVIGPAVQVVTKGGDKHLIKFQVDPRATIARIEANLR